MTDYTDLVNWLRDNAIGVVSFRPKFIEAANAIEEQADRIAEIAEQYNRARLTTFSAEMLRDATDETVQLRARIAALEAENAKLKAKLMAAVGEMGDAARAAMEGKDD